MNTDEIFATAFVKRAMAYGYTENDAVGIWKQASPAAASFMGKAKAGFGQAVDATKNFVGGRYRDVRDLKKNYNTSRQLQDLAESGGVGGELKGHPNVLEGVKQTRNAVFRGAGTAGAVGAAGLGGAAALEESALPKNEDNSWHDRSHRNAARGAMLAGVPSALLSALAAVKGGRFVNKALKMPGGIGSDIGNALTGAAVGGGAGAAGGALAGKALTRVTPRDQAPDPSYLGSGARGGRTGLVAGGALGAAGGAYGGLRGGQLLGLLAKNPELKAALAAGGALSGAAAGGVGGAALGYGAGAATGLAHRALEGAPKPQEQQLDPQSLAMLEQELAQQQQG